MNLNWSYNFSILCLHWQRIWADSCFSGIWFDARRSRSSGPIQQNSLKRGHQHSRNKSSCYQNWSGYSITVCSQEVDPLPEQPYTISVTGQLEGLSGNVLTPPSNLPQQKHTMIRRRSICHLRQSSGILNICSPTLLCTYCLKQGFPI
jgi:hypothetical protein